MPPQHDPRQRLPAEPRTAGGQQLRIALAKPVAATRAAVAPVEGINQVQVNADIGLTFATALQSFLRQDPDIMMIGEIRNLETAQIAVQAALAEAMAQEQDTFPNVCISMVRAGEEGGALRPVLTRVGEFLVRSEAIRQKVISALIYPAILMFVAIGSIVLILTFVRKYDGCRTGPVRR
jgi:type II secretory pathway component PulF